jgi:hypothetical protein
MKKLIFLTILMFIGINLYGQNTYKYQIYANGGLSVGTGGEKIAQIQVVDGFLWFIYAGDTISTGVKISDQTPLADYAVLKHADTLLVTDNYTLVLADDGRTIAATKATGMYILIPEDATVDFPEGTVINVFMGGAGPVGFQGVGSVILHAAKDSVVINTQWGWATLRKRTTNIWLVFGHLED